jgi:hypothetical protein
MVLWVCCLQFRWACRTSVCLNTTSPQYAFFVGAPEQGSSASGSAKSTGEGSGAAYCGSATVCSLRLYRNDERALSHAVHVPWVYEMQRRSVGGAEAEHRIIGGPAFTGVALAYPRLTLVVYFLKYTTSVSVFKNSALSKVPTCLNLAVSAKNFLCQQSTSRSCSHSSSPCMAPPMEYKSSTPRSENVYTATRIGRGRRVV